ncbi:hypothetical protein LTR36_006342 [Oleoguttula mirabilis]|uniref:Tr-type G domain-containing protein n=1 Tax=Oleoguttula mirabilis TaxID=1507867 RepID=A0AAV9JUE1_9PEZI|nr:hypothetical protein LTR36_006342 [Oleoguttula mirabilis]
MQRVKNVGYDEDELYDEEDDVYEEDGDPGYTAEDRANFSALTPVVRAELEEAGVQASDQDIGAALWHYFWDVGKSVSYLKNSRTPRPQQQGVKKEDKPKAKSKFDEAAQKSAETAAHADMPPMSAADWFRDVPWTQIPPEMEGSIVPATPVIPRPKLLGGSSKLARLAEERRKKAVAAANVASPPVTNGASSSLDRLSRPKDTKENEAPVPKVEPKRYPIRKKREPTPPPKEPTPPPPEPEEEEKPDLRASPTSFGRTLAASLPHSRYTPSMTLKDMLGSGVTEDPFKGPSPDDTKLTNGCSITGNTGKTKQPAANGLAKKTEALKLGDSAPSAPSPPKVRSKGLDVPNLWAGGKSKRKASAAFVVIGHVDHGKSTLMGRLLLDTGAVSQRDVDRYQKQATELGKSSFALAWVMDTGTEERERGVTVDIAQHHFSTDSVNFTILDAPGHRDFVPNMIGGASMADLAVLVVDANQLESGMKGQTREHVLLAKAVGLKRVLVAVNKLDATAPYSWSQDVFQKVKNDVLKFLGEAGFAANDITVVPCSGLSGENVAKAPKPNEPAAWVARTDLTLLKALEQAVPSGGNGDAVKRPLRMQVADVFRGGITNPLSVSGRMTAGNAQPGDPVLVQPSGETATVRGVEVSGEPRDYAVAGDICTLHLTDIDPIHICTGDVVCDPSQKVPVVESFTAEIEALDSLLPQSVDVHLGRLHTAGSITRLVATVDDKGVTLKKKPRMVKAGQRAIVKVAVEDGVPVEGGEMVVLRAQGETVGFGIVERTGG